MLPQLHAILGRRTHVCVCVCVCVCGSVSLCVYMGESMSVRLV